METENPEESGAFLSYSRTPVIRTPAMVEVGKLPNYTDVETDNNGNAILPSDFFPNILDNLPLEWFYKTYSYFPFFDRKQRDENGILCVPANMRTATEGNVAKWKDCVMMLGDQKFKRTQESCCTVMRLEEWLRLKDTCVKGRQKGQRLVQ